MPATSWAHEQQTPWHALAVFAVLKRLNSREDGLSDSEARARQKIYGANTLPQQKQPGVLAILARQARGMFTVILAIAAGAAFLLGDYIDAAVISAAVVINIVFGFLQEFKAQRALEALSQVIQFSAVVMRDGKPQERDAQEIVPGDIVVVSAGERAPADIRIISARSAAANEAPLTGESAFVNKNAKALTEGTSLSERANMLFMGTALTRGEIRGVVAATGLQTEFGKIAATLGTVPDETTPLEQRLGGLARAITVAVFVLSFATLALGMSIGLPFDEMFTTSVAVAVAAVPEGLIVAVTMILALGMMQLLRRNALVRRLKAAETLGAVTVICVDKTGTITEGNMRVSEVVPADMSDAECRLTILETAAYANEAWIAEGRPTRGHEAGGIFGEPTDAAILEAALAAGLHQRIDERESRIFDFMPFDSDNKFVAALAKAEGGGARLFIKGAAERLIAASTHARHREGNIALSDQGRAALTRRHNDFASAGMRLIAVAFRDVPQHTRSFAELGETLSGLTFLGFIALEDPVREQVSDALREARGAGVKVVVITGDNAVTASVVAQKVGLVRDHEISLIAGEELERLSDEELVSRIGTAAIFARTTPHQKLRIVEALKRNGEVVAMTGDGINDAPALKAAHIGVAVGAGTDVAKQTADLVVLDNNFATIIAAIYEGRRIFDNIRKVVLYLLADAATEVILVLGGLLFVRELPVLAAQILFVNLVEDSPPAFTLAFEKAEKGIMRQNPRRAAEPIVNRQMLTIIVAVGVLRDLGLLAAFMWLHGQLPVDVVRTILFATLGSNAMLTIFSIRGLRIPVWRMNPFSNKWLLVAVAFGMTAIVAAVYVPFLQGLLHTAPLAWWQWGLIAELGLLNVLAIEVVKFFAPRIPLLRESRHG